MNVKLSESNIANIEIEHQLGDRVLILDTYVVGLVEGIYIQRNGPHLFYVAFYARDEDNEWPLIQPFTSGEITKLTEKK